MDVKKRILEQAIRRENMSRDAAGIKDLCLSHRISVAVAESLTAGKIQDALASVKGASGYFLGGMTVYNLDAKVGLLGVDREHAEKVNCVSEDVAIQMAQAVALLFGADIGVATTGYAEPDSERGITPHANWAIASQSKVLLYGDDDFPSLWPSRNGVRTEVTATVLKNLRELLVAGVKI